MHKQHPQTAYRKYAILIGTIFENCDKKDSCVFLFRSCLHFYPLVRASISMTVLYKISFPPVNREKDCFLSVFVVSLFAGKALFCKCSGHASLLGVIVRVILLTVRLFLHEILEGGFHHGSFRYCFFRTEPFGYSRHRRHQCDVDDLKGCLSGQTSGKTLFEKIMTRKMTARSYQTSAVIFSNVTPEEGS